MCIRDRHPGGERGGAVQHLPGVRAIRLAAAKRAAAKRAAVPATRAADAAAGGAGTGEARGGGGGTAKEGGMSENGVEAKNETPRISFGYP